MAVSDGVKSQGPLDQSGQRAIFTDAYFSQSIHLLRFESDIQRLSFVSIVNFFSSHESILLHFAAKNKKDPHGAKWNQEKIKKITCNGGCPHLHFLHRPDFLFPG